ncbi:hypothetical protein [Nonomuraea endophytica]|uniref:Uncharacterized protein n=1 Tax=Nonomuraea endophytica TaxID=714136 RepID=A0A7W8A4T5_9ACTN|nr:hypothetical protein [Nonomuraea endophytica]MBB5079582.1 hypothetical protein [Nonomuraea endophytica]
MPVAEQARVKRTISGIAEALHGACRVQFFAELVSAEMGSELSSVLDVWWSRAMLDTAPAREPDGTPPEAP